MFNTFPKVQTSGEEKLREANAQLRALAAQLHDLKARSIEQRTQQMLRLQVLAPKVSVSRGCIVLF